MAKLSSGRGLYWRRFIIVMLLAVFALVLIRLGNVLFNTGYQVADNRRLEQPVSSNPQIDLANLQAGQFFRAGLPANPGKELL